MGMLRVQTVLSVDTSSMASRAKREAASSVLRILRSPKEEDASFARNVYFLYNDGTNGRIRHACVMIEYMIPASSALSLQIGSQQCFLRYDLTRMEVVEGEPYIILSERWSSSSGFGEKVILQPPKQPLREQPCQDNRDNVAILRGPQTLDSYTEHMVARPTRPFSRRQVKELMVAKWQDRQNYVDEGLKADSSGGSQANNNCVTFAKTLWRMLALGKELPDSTEGIGSDGLATCKAKQGNRRRSALAQLAKSDDGVVC